MAAPNTSAAQQQMMLRRQYAAQQATTAAPTTQTTAGPYGTVVVGRNGVPLGTVQTRGGQPITQQTNANGTTTSTGTSNTYSGGFYGANVNGLNNVIGAQTGIPDPTAGVNNQSLFPGLNTLPGYQSTNISTGSGTNSGVTYTYNATTGQYVPTTGGNNTGVTYTYNATTGQYVPTTTTTNNTGVTYTYNAATGQYVPTTSTNNGTGYVYGYGSPYSSYGYGNPYASYSNPYGGYTSTGYGQTGLSNPYDAAAAVRAGLPQYRSVAPILGLTTPAAPLVGRVGASTRYRVVDDTVTGGSTVGQPQQRVAGSRQEIRSSETDEESLDVKSSPMTRQQVSLVNHAQEIMENRPITEGEVMAVGATGVQVKFRMNGEFRTDRFPVKEVFFFKENGEMASAATSPAALSLGARVLIPLPVQQPSRSVATYSKSPAAQGDLREDGSISVTPPPSIATGGDVQEKVAGSRETYTSRTHTDANGNVIKQKVAGSRQTSRKRRAAH